MMAEGIITLMGSGELTSTMVEVHKELLTRIPSPPRPVFIDTPAGFQLNSDQISRRALEYFQTRVGQRMELASFRSSDISESEAEKAYRSLREANYYLIGPGSPSYAVRHWKKSLVPDILGRGIEEGACLVAASAAALTIGSKTLPVYEIYKVGQPLHWLEGIDILGRFGFDLVIIPHWNNMEGGTHDTRFCYMGEPRFRELEAGLPDGTGVLGLDEHTGLILDLREQTGEIRGIGMVTLRIGGRDRTFHKGESFPLSLLRDGPKEYLSPATPAPEKRSDKIKEGISFWKRIHSAEEGFKQGLEEFAPDKLTAAILELDGIIWEAHRDLESEEFIAQAREIFRELVVLLGVRIESWPGSRRDCLAPLIELLLNTRKRLRDRREWEAADALRSGLQRLGIAIEDTDKGTRWHLEEKS